eukprot:gene12013-827_t
MKLYGVAVAYLIGALLVAVLPLEAMLSRNTFFSGGGKGNAMLQKPSALLVIAHPDDEAMFFGPLLRTIRDTHIVHVLCLCTGDYDGLGKIRVPELRASCKVLVPTVANVMVVDDPAIADGPNSAWLKFIGGYVARYIAEHSIDQVFTFDDGGVSGHCNHADVARGVKWVLTKGAAGSGSAGTNCLVSPITNRKKGKTQPTQSASAAGGGGGGGGGSGGAQRSTVTESCTGGTEVEQHRPPVPSTVRGYSLRTTSVCKKYLGVIDAACTPEDIEAIWFAMVAHASQLVWFRRLYLWFSRYVYVNTFDNIAEPSAN